MTEDAFDENVGYGDAGEEYSHEIEEEKIKRYPSVSEILGMCVTLGIKCDPRRGIKEEDAWAYYHELKARVEQHQRKTA